MKRMLMLLALAWPLTATALLPCPKVEYADARDWPPERLEAAYCEYTANIALGESFRATQRGENASTLRMAGMVDECREHAEKFARILQNVKARALPRCADGKPAPR